MCSTILSVISHYRHTSTADTLTNLLVLTRYLTSAAFDGTTVLRTDSASIWSSCFNTFQGWFSHVDCIIIGSTSTSLHTTRPSLLFLGGSSGCRANQRLHRCDLDATSHIVHICMHTLQRVFLIIKQNSNFGSNDGRQTIVTLRGRAIVAEVAIKSETTQNRGGPLG